MGQRSLATKSAGIMESLGTITRIPQRRILAAFCCGEDVATKNGNFSGQNTHQTRPSETSTKRTSRKPFTPARHVQAGEVLFHKGDVAREIFVAMSGRFRLVEIDIEIIPSHVIGEFGLVESERNLNQIVSNSPMCRYSWLCRRVEHHSRCI